MIYISAQFCYWEWLNVHAIFDSAQSQKSAFMKVVQNFGESDGRQST